MIKRFRLALVICLALILTAAAGCGQSSDGPAPKAEKPQKDKIVIGGSRSLSGPLAGIGATGGDPVLKMWADEVNAKGGIYVKEYDKKLLVETKIYDDKSDVGTMTRLLEKAIVEDKVDFIFPPVGTAMIYAAGPIANKHQKIMIGMEGGATSLKAELAKMPYVFTSLNFSDTQIPAMVDILAQKGVKKVGIMFIADLHGSEYSGAAVPALATKGIEVALVKSVPPEIKDVSPILKEAQAAGVDAFLSFAYPDQNILVVKQSMELGFNPKAMVLGPGGQFNFFKNIFGEEAMEGIMAFGAWSPKQSPALKELHDKYSKLYKIEEAGNWWGTPFYYGALQFLEKAIEKAGTLDSSVIKDVIAKETFETVLGPTSFKNGLLDQTANPGEIGQWQKGVFEVVGPKATAEVIYPKPQWPKK